jgi:hypothetical protein
MEFTWLEDKYSKKNINDTCFLKQLLLHVSVILNGRKDQVLCHCFLCVIFFNVIFCVSVQQKKKQTFIG